MTAAIKMTPLVSPLLSWAEICERYPDQHVVLIDDERSSTNDMEICFARVIGSGATHREAFTQAESWCNGLVITHRFIGDLELDSLNRGVIGYVEDAESIHS